MFVGSRALVAHSIRSCLFRAEGIVLAASQSPTTTLVELAPWVPRRPSEFRLPPRVPRRLWLSLPPGSHDDPVSSAGLQGPTTTLSSKPLPPRVPRRLWLLQTPGVPQRPQSSSLCLLGPTTTQLSPSRLAAPQAVTRREERSSETLADWRRSVLVGSPVIREIRSSSSESLVEAAPHGAAGTPHL